MNAYNFRDIEAFVSRFYNGSKLSLTPYNYTLTFSNLTAGATALQTLNFQANADFVMLGISYFTNLHSTPHGLTYSSMPIPLVRALLTDSGSSQPMMNSATNLNSLAEQGAFSEKSPYYPRFLSGRSSLQVQLTNFSDTEAYDIDFVLHGVNVQALAG